MSTNFDDFDDDNELEPLVPPSPTSISFQKPWYKRASIYWLLPAFAIYSITIGMDVVPKVKFYLITVCHDYYSRNGQFPDDVPSDEMCNNPDVQAITSRFMMMYTLCSAIPAIFILGPLGSLSDRKGRRVCLLIAITGTILVTLSRLLVGNGILGLYFLLVGALFEGLSGGYFSLIMSCHAYVADCSHPDQRSAVFGSLQGALFAGFAIGPTIGGWIVEITDDLLSVFYITLIVHVMLFMFFLLIIPESLTKEQLKKHHQELDSKINTQKSWMNRFFSLIYNVFEPLTIFFPTSNDSREHDKTSSVAGKYSLLILTIINVLLSIAVTGIQAVFILYVTLVFRWSLVEQGYLLFMTGATRAFVLLVLFPALVSRFKKSTHLKNDYKQSYNAEEQVVVIEEDNDSMNGKNEQTRKELVFDMWIIRLALIIDTLAYHVLGLTTSSSMFIGAIAVASLGSVGFPTIKSLQTNLVAPSKTGQLLGAISVLDSIIRVIAPLIFNTLYSILVKTSPNFIWYGVSGSLAVACLISFAIGPRKYN